MKTRGRRRGIAIVEFAITLPLLVLIIMGTIEAASMIFLKQSLEIAAYEGARISLVPGSDVPNVQLGSQAILDARNVTATTISVTPADFSSQPNGTPIRVLVTADCASNALFSPWFYVGRTTSADVVMMKEH